MTDVKGLILTGNMMSGGSIKHILIAESW